MNYPPTPSVSLRPFLAAPGLLLMGCLLAILGAVHLEIAGLVPAKSFQAKLAPPSREGSAAPSISAAQKLIEADASEYSGAGLFLREVSQIDTLLRLLDKPNGTSAQTAWIADLRTALRAVVNSALELESPEEGGADSLENEAAQFRVPLEAYGKRATMAREKACLAEIEQHFAAALEAGRALRVTAREKAALGLQFAEMMRQDAPPASRPRTNVPSQAGASAEVGSRTRWAITALVTMAGWCAVFSVLLQKKRLSTAVRQIVSLAGEFSRGAEPSLASLPGSPEFAPLAQAFRKMVEARQTAERSLQRAHDSLELKVSARTAELWRANKALQEGNERRALLENEFHQSQKMDALGKLAGSIAHDFNNLLTVIIGGAESVQKQIGPNHPAAPLLRTVAQAGERAAGLTQPLLTFSRNEVLALEVIDLNAATEEAVRMLQRLLGINIELRVDLASDLHAIKANGNQIQQVLVNLGVNARDAMAVNGTLTISTRNILREPPETAAPGKRPTSWVQLTVRDTGCGMDAATRARIFEPFFTTKPVGKGTGLGLATVFGIVNQLGGSIEVESAPGEGTAFLIFLPATSEARAAKPALVVVPPAQVAPRSERGMVLLVDDEPEIRELASLTLEECGYEVLTAAHAEDAILLAEKHRGKIRALVTDVVMPGINGVQLAEVLCKVVPGIRVLFVSGHGKDAVPTSTLVSAHANYLQKPYRGQALIDKLKEVLAGKETQFHSSEIDPTALWMS